MRREIGKSSRPSGIPGHAPDAYYGNPDEIPFSSVSSSVSEAARAFEATWRCACCAPRLDATQSNATEFKATHPQASFAGIRINLERAHLERAAHRTFASQAIAQRRVVKIITIGRNSKNGLTSRSQYRFIIVSLRQ
jgi:hypothetical protein